MIKGLIHQQNRQWILSHKKNKISLLEATWMELGDIMLGEIRWTMTKLYDITYT